MGLVLEKAPKDAMNGVQWDMPSDSDKEDAFS
jgi:hypothetical protein